MVPLGEVGSLARELKSRGLSEDDIDELEGAVERDSQTGKR